MRRTILDTMRLLRFTLLERGTGLSVSSDRATRFIACGRIYRYGMAEVDGSRDGGLRVLAWEVGRGLRKRWVSRVFLAEIIS